jgi:hypothetical protein
VRFPRLITQFSDEFFHTHAFADNGIEECFFVLEVIVNCRGSNIRRPADVADRNVGETVAGEEFLCNIQYSLFLRGGRHMPAQLKRVVSVMDTSAAIEGA